MKTRIITSVVALAVLAAVLLAPAIVFNIALGAVIIIMLHECYTSAGASKSVMAAGFLSAAAMMAAAYKGIPSAVPIWENGYIVLSVLLTVLIHMGAVVAEHGKTNYADVLANGFLTIYITLSMSCLAVLRAEFGTMLMLLVFICAWTTDTGAYFCGKAFGKKKLIPHVSPNKTVAGSIGGIITAIVACIIYIAVYLKTVGAQGTDAVSWLIPSVAAGAVIGGISGVFSQIGDLAASAVKRDTGVKDFGWIFPGHGGFMDRFDSVLYISPIIYVILHFVI